MDAELLLIDDLGMEPLMENTTAVQFYNLLNERRKRGLSTVISSNLTMSDVKNRYTERVSSRLLDADACRVIHLLGRDVRLMRACFALHRARKPRSTYRLIAVWGPVSIGTTKVTQFHIDNKIRWRREWDSVFWYGK